MIVLFFAFFAFLFFLSLFFFWCVCCLFCFCVVHTWLGGVGLRVWCVCVVCVWWCFFSFFGGVCKVLEKGGKERERRGSPGKERKSSSGGCLFVIDRCYDLDGKNKGMERGR